MCHDDLKISVFLSTGAWTILPYIHFRFKINEFCRWKTSKEERLVRNKISRKRTFFIIQGGKIRFFLWQKYEKKQAPFQYQYQEKII